MFLALIAISSLTSLSLIALHHWLNRSRQKRLHTLQLTPNCLLTRYPIVFISGRRSLFYFLNYWNQIPDYLREHGYLIQELKLSWRDQNKRTSQLLKFIRELEAPCHLIGDDSIESELELVRRLHHPNISSVTSVQVIAREKALTVSDLQPRQDALAAILLNPVEKAVTTWPFRVQQTLFLFHNLFSNPGMRVKDEAIGLALSHEPWLIEQKFLEFAVQLAERDLRFSEPQ